ncbi:MAG: hypothetical protein NVSMB6_25970 [Burkholderiaceae bacterium]
MAKTFGSKVMLMKKTQHAKLTICATKYYRLGIKSALVDHET